MPNHCYNILHLECFENARLLDEFVQKHKTEDSELSFHMSVPCPENSDNDWRTDNWGTKWEAIDVDIRKTPEIVEYTFATAWSPPLQWMRSVSNKYPEIKFTIEYYECGMDFCGKEICVNGDTIKSETMALSDYNWGQVKKDVLHKIIEEETQNTKITNDNILELVDSIMESYADKDTYYENIEMKIHEILEKKLST